MIKPSQQEIFQFIASTHALERIKCPNNEIEVAYKSQTPLKNPYADGHLQAINYIFNLIDKTHFLPPPASITNKYHSNSTLSWLKDIHRIMLQPLLNHPVTRELVNGLPTKQNLGNYRIDEAFNTFSACPPPELLPEIMHQWLLKLSTFHDKIKVKVTKTYEISQELSQNIILMAYQTNLFISTVQPFKDANSRLGRLVENTMRLQWRLPWKNYSGANYDQFIQDLVDYQKLLPAICKSAITNKM